MITVIRKIKSFITAFVLTKSMLAKKIAPFSQVEHHTYSLRLKNILPKQKTTQPSYLNRIIKKSEALKAITAFGASLFMQ